MYVCIYRRLFHTYITKSPLLSPNCKAIKAKWLYPIRTTWNYHRQNKFLTVRKVRPPMPPPKAPPKELAGGINNPEQWPNTQMGSEHPAFTTFADGQLCADTRRSMTRCASRGVRGEQHPPYAEDSEPMAERHLVKIIKKGLQKSFECFVYVMAVDDAAEMECCSATGAESQKPKYPNYAINGRPSMTMTGGTLP